MNERWCEGSKVKIGKKQRKSEGRERKRTGQTTQKKDRQFYDLIRLNGPCH